MKHKYYLKNKEIKCRNTRIFVGNKTEIMHHVLTCRTYPCVVNIKSDCEGEGGNVLASYIYIYIFIYIYWAAVRQEFIIVKNIRSLFL